MAERNIRILVLCINYHAAADSERFIRDLFALECGKALDVRLVDNSAATSPQPSFPRLEEEFPNLKLLSPHGNLGYFGGAAHGLKDYLRTNDPPEWVVVANTDLSFPQNDFFARLLDLYEGEKPPAVLAPAIISGQSGSDQNPYMRFRPSAGRMSFYRSVFRCYPLSLLYHCLALIKSRFSRKTPGGRDIAPPLRIYAPQGSFILFHRTYFSSGGSLEFGSFLFGEEIFVGETARRLGLFVQYDPRLRVFHREHAVTGLFRNRKMARFQSDSCSYLYREYFS
jgi:GT2 family glycosyltransferase